MTASNSTPTTAAAGEVIAAAGPSQRGRLSAARLSAAIDEYYAAVDAGTAIDKERFFAKYRDVADELAECLQSLDFIQCVAPQLAGNAAAPFPPHGAGGAATLGDFRLLRELGRGGMGVVYEAEQLSLGRRVALKVLPFAAMLDKQQLKRFKNEARAAATLDHPNIVAVHSVGEERGVHYYAMQLVEGESLAQVIARLRNADGGMRKGTPDAPRPATPTFSRDAKVLRSGARPAGQLRTAECGLRTDEEANSTPNRPSEVRDPHSAVQNPQSPPRIPHSALDTTAARALTTLPDRNSREHFRTIARLGIQAAEALDHAHASGILHRDIKPGNLLVECTPQCSHHAPRDETNFRARLATKPHHAERDDYTLWITDFGLARFETDASLTMTGDLLGTLRYMSPEQALGQRGIVDHRGDVYSLGATLYELLTLRPLLDADDPRELLRQIADVEPTPPRRLDERIPRDLETIVLKATAKDPPARYGTAQELADDLRRFLDAKPIAARRPSLADRARKWSRRHAAMAAGGATLLLLVAAIAAAAAVITARAYRAERHHRQQAEANLVIAGDAIDRALVRAANAQYVAGNLADAEKLASDAIEFYERLVAHSDAPDVHFRAAQAHAMIATIWGLAGRYERQRQAARRSLALVAPLVDQYPEERDYLAACARAYAEMGESQFGRSEYDAALESYRWARAYYEQASKQSPRSVPLRLHVVGVMASQADVLAIAHRWDEAEAIYRRIVDEYANLPPRFVAATPEAATRHAGLLSNWSLVRRGRGDFQGAIALLDEAIALQRKSLNKWPTNPIARDFLFKHLEAMAGTRLLAGQHEQAAQAVEELVAEFPDRLASYSVGAATLLGCAKSAAFSPATDADEAKSAAVSYYKLASDLLNRASSATVRHPEALNNLAWLLLTCEPPLRDPYRALELAEEAVTQAPHRAALRTTLALARYRNAKLIGAAQALESAIRLSADGRPNALYSAFLNLIPDGPGDLDSSDSLGEASATELSGHAASGGMVGWYEAAERIERTAATPP